MRKRALLGFALTAISFACDTAGAAGSSDEQKIRELDAAWSQAADRKDAAKCASFYSETGSVLPANGPIATGRGKIQATWAGMMATPGYSLTFAPTKIEVSKSRDMAYDVGTYLFKLLDANGKQVLSVGKYVVVWKKHKDGVWRVELDIFNGDK